MSAGFNIEQDDSSILHKARRGDRATTEGPPEDRLASVIRHALDECDIACFDSVEDADEFYTELEAELTRRGAD
jgi:hypothetical protein